MLSVATNARADAELCLDLDQIVREGARRMLAAALEAEVDDYLAASAAERDEQGRRLVVRNGHARQREVTTVAGAVAVRAPRVNDRRIDPQTGQRVRFRSVILPPWCRKSPKVAEVLPLLYLHGLSTGDFVPALEAFFGSAAGCRRRSSRAWSLGGRPTTRRSVAATSPTATMCMSGPTGSISGCGWSRPGCAVW
jgi:putative transposase